MTPDAPSSGTSGRRDAARLLARLFSPGKGIDVPGHKDRTRRLPITDGPQPHELIFPMRMHSGAPASVRVQTGDRVAIGALLGEGEGRISARIHSSVSGRVTGVEERAGFRGPSLSVIVENDMHDEESVLEPLGTDIAPEAFFERLQACGITGKGGAGFPTHVKLRPQGPGGHRFMLINGAECEPYSTTDHRVMLEYTDELLHTADFLRRLFGPLHSVIAVEDDKHDAIECLRRRAGDLGYRDIAVREVRGYYPQGDQGILFNTVFGREIPHGKNPNDIGLLTCNVSTLKAIHDAVFHGRPLVRRVVTVTGPAIAEPGNVLARIGTPVRELIAWCGGFRTPPGKLVNGGPMMGMPFDNLDIPVVKDTTTILCLGADARQTPDERPCIRCARCVDVCPVNLQPIGISNAWRSGRIERCRDLKADSCIRCGCCTYICPSRIPLLDDIRSAIPLIS